jgi:hypothetical protein
MQTNITPQTTTRLLINNIIRSFILHTLLFATLTSAGLLEHDSKGINLLATGSSTTPSITAAPKITRTLHARYGDGDGDDEMAPAVTVVVTLPPTTTYITAAATDIPGAVTVTVTNVPITTYITGAKETPGVETVTFTKAPTTTYITAAKDVSEVTVTVTNPILTTVLLTQTAIHNHAPPVAMGLYARAQEQIVTQNNIATVMQHPTELSTRTAQPHDAHQTRPNVAMYTSPKTDDKCSWQRANMHCSQTIISLVAVILVLAMIFGAGGYYYFCIHRPFQKAKDEAFFRESSDGGESGISLSSLSDGSLKSKITNSSFGGKVAKLGHGNGKVSSRFPIALSASTHSKVADRGEPYVFPYPPTVKETTFYAPPKASSPPPALPETPRLPGIDLSGLSPINSRITEPFPPFEEERGRSPTSRPGTNSRADFYGLEDLELQRQAKEDDERIEREDDERIERLMAAADISYGPKNEEAVDTPSSPLPETIPLPKTSSEDLSSISRSQSPAPSEATSIQEDKKANSKRKRISRQVKKAKETEDLGGWIGKM